MEGKLTFDRGTADGTSEEQGNILAKQAGDPGSKWTKQKGGIV